VHAVPLVDGGTLIGSVAFHYTARPSDDALRGAERIVEALLRD